MTISLAQSTTIRERGPLVSLLTPPFVALVATTAAVLLHWQGADWPALEFRIELFRRAGFVLWNMQWYHGHHIPGYSVLAPPVGALLGANVLAVASSVAAAYCFGRLTRAHLGASATVGALWFAVATTANVAVGRITFASGMAVALAALLMLRLHRRPVAIGLAMLCPLTSPVAAVFLGIAVAAWTLAQPPRQRTFGIAMTASTLAPIAALALLFPEGGAFTYTPLEFAATMTLCATVLLLVPAHERTIRYGAALYAAAAVLTFVVPTPLGGNIGRLGMFVGGPLLACVLWRTRRAALLAIVPLALVWQWNPAIDGILLAGRDPSTHASYHQPLIRFLQRQSDAPARVEIPFTKEHWEAAYVAMEVPLARGWERQLDRATNPLFYDGQLTPAEYRRWLVRNAVTYVALPDATLDPSAAEEAKILAHRPSFLTPIWHNEHWRVWRVVDAQPLVTGSARLVSMRPDSMTLDVSNPGVARVRVHYTPFWTLDGPGCIVESADGWTTLRLRRTGPIQLRSTLFGRSEACP